MDEATSALDNEAEKILDTVLELNSKKSNSNLISQNLRI